MEKRRRSSRSIEIAGMISRKIDSWLKEKDRLIIGIDGYSASGKTTVADCLEEENASIAVIHLDDLLISSEERVSMMNSGEDRSKIFELKWYRYDLLSTMVEKFKRSEKYSTHIYDYDLKKMVAKHYDLSKSVLVIEGIFLFHREHAISGIFDKKIYLDVNFEEADDIRTEREKRRWGKEYVDESHPDSFIRPFKEAYRRYFFNQHPEKSADFVINV